MACTSSYGEKQTFRYYNSNNASLEFITRIEAQELPPVEPTVTYYGQMEGLLGQGSALVFDCLKSQTFWRSWSRST